MPSIVVKPIMPKRSLASLGQKVVNQQAARLQQDGENIRRDFEKTTATWNHKPRFEVNLLRTASQMTVYVYTDDEIYQYVDKGTRPHVIRPRRAKALRFQWGGPGSYKAKTSVGVISSRAGGSSGPEVLFKHVTHPGTAARNFTEVIQKKWAPKLTKALQDIVTQVFRGSA